MSAPPVRPCPSCGEESMRGIFCQACGERVVKRVARPVVWRALTGALWILAVPALCFGGVLAACGLLFWEPPRALPEFVPTAVAVFCFGLIAALLAVLVRACTRDSAGYRDVPFGRSEEGPRP